MPVEGGEYIQLTSFEFTPEALYNGCGSAFSVTGDAFAQAVQDRLPSQDWVEIDWRGDGAFQIMSDAWKELSRRSRYERRYFFHELDERDTVGFEWSPIRLLDAIASLAHAHELINVITPDTPIFRARMHEGNEEPRGPEELGPAPKRAARPNRMSPQGISMFYGALDRETALAETQGPRTTAAWLPLRALQILDLRTLPTVPSIFDSQAASGRAGIKFLHEFRQELRKPVDRDEQAAIEYVPTQIVTEYFRTATTVDGIVYPSSLCEGSCCVLFFDASACVESRSSDDRWSPEQVLRLRARSVRRHSG